MTTRTDSLEDIVSLHLQALRGAIKPRDFKLGDLVKLKSGSQNMTVSQIREHTGTIYIEATWYDFTTRNFHEHTFVPDMLERAGVK